MIVLEHHAERARLLTLKVDPSLLRTALLRDIVRLASKRLNPIFEKDPEYNNGLLYPGLLTKAEILNILEVELSIIQDVNLNKAQIVPDSDSFSDPVCVLCGNFTDFQGSIGCRLDRIQNRHKTSLSFAPEEDF